MNKNEFIDRRTQIISKMLDNPNECGIYNTGTCFAELDDLFDDLTGGDGSGPSWCQIDRDKLGREVLKKVGSDVELK